LSSNVFLVEAFCGYMFISTIKVLTHWCRIKIIFTAVKITLLLLYAGTGVLKKRVKMREIWQNKRRKFKYQ
jgi:hypothetical protein